MEGVVKSSTFRTEAVSMVTSTPTTISPTTVSMNIVSDTDDGEGMMEVIRSDGTQVYHTVNVNVDEAVKKLNAPTSELVNPSSSKVKKSSISSISESLLASDVAKLKSVSSNEKNISAMSITTSSMSVPKTSTSVRVVFASPTMAGQSLGYTNVIRQASGTANTKTVSIMPSGARPAFPLIRPSGQEATNKRTFVLVRPSVPMNQVGIQRVVMPVGQNKALQTVIPLQGGRYMVPNSQNLSTSGKPVITILPQGQVNTMPGTQMVVAPRPNLTIAPNFSLPPGFKLVPVSSSSALKPSDGLPIPAAVNKNTLDNKAFNDLLKSIAQQTVNTRKTVTEQATSSTVPVKNVSLTTSTIAASATSIASSPSMVPPPLKVLPFSISSTGLVMTTQSITSMPSSRAVVKLATAGFNTSTNIPKPMDMSEIKIDSVYSLNDFAKNVKFFPEKADESAAPGDDTQKEVGLNNSEINDKSQKPASPLKENSGKANGDNEQNDDFVVLAEWAKESDNEDDGNEFEDTDVDSDDEDNVSNSKVAEESNDPVDIETVSKDEESVARKEHSSNISGLDVDDNEKAGDDGKKNENDSDTTEIADVSELESDFPEPNKTLSDSTERQTTKVEIAKLQTEHDSVKENQAPENNLCKIERSKSDINKTDISNMLSVGTNNDPTLQTNVSKAVNNAELTEGRYPLRLTAERSPEAKKVEFKVVKIEPGVQNGKRASSSGRIKSDSPRSKKLRHRKRKMNMMMKVMYWKREHKYMFDCKVLLPKLSKIDSSVNLNSFKPPVIPKHVLDKVRHSGDDNWCDVLVDRVPNRQHRKRDKTEGEKDKESGRKKMKKVKDLVDMKQDEMFIVKTVNGESKLVKVSTPEKKMLFKSIAPKLLSPNLATAVSVTPSSGVSTFTISAPTKAAVATVASSTIRSFNALSSPTRTTLAPTSLLASKTVLNVSRAPEVTVPGVQRIVVQSGTQNKPLRHTVIAKPGGSISNIAKPTGIRTVVTVPTPSIGAQDAKPLLTTQTKKGPISLVPIAPAKKMPETVSVSVGGTSVSVPVSVLVKAQAMGCKLAFQLPTSSSGGNPRPILIQPTPSTTGGATLKTTFMPSTVNAPTRPLLITSSTSAKSYQAPGAPPLNVKPLVIAPIPSSDASTPDVLQQQAHVSVSPVKPIVIQPVNSVVSTSLSTAAVCLPSAAITTTCPIVSTVSSTASTATVLTSNRNGNQRYLVLNTSSGKMIMPMPAALAGTPYPGKSILNIPSVVPKTNVSVPTSSSASGSPMFLMAKGPGNNQGSQNETVMVNIGGHKTPMVLKRVAPGAIRGAAPKSVFTIRAAQSSPNQTIVKPISAPISVLPKIAPRPVVTQAPPPNQRSPAARQTRMIQRLSEFMSPAAAAALAASVPPEPIEITPRPIKIEPNDSANFNFPIHIKDEPKTIGYGDENGSLFPSLENVQLKDEPPSSDSDSESEEGNGSGEPLSKQPRLDGITKKTAASTESSPVPKQTEPPPGHDARSRIQELREKLRKAMADVDQIRQKRRAHSTDDSNDESQH